MPTYPVRALVLRHTKLGETDVILTLLSDAGKPVRAVAKGLRRPGSRFCGRLEPYSEVDLLLHTGKSLEVVSEVRSVDAHAALRSDLDRTAAAAVVADLMDRLAVDEQSEPKLFDAAAATFAAIEAAAAAKVPALVVAFLIKALSVHGYRPELHACVACSAGVSGLVQVRFSPAQGGILCPECERLDPSAPRCLAQAREWLAMLLRSPLAEVADADMPPTAVSECFALLRVFVAYHVPARLKALDFYAGLLFEADKVSAHPGGRG